MNIVLWCIFSGLILEIGLNFWQKSQDITNKSKVFIKKGELLTIIGYLLVISCVLVPILILLRVVPAPQFFPNEYLAINAFDVDVSIIINILLIYFLFNIIYRVGSRIIGRSITLMTEINAVEEGG